LAKKALDPQASIAYAGVEKVDLHYGAAIALRQVSVTVEVGAVTT
jgi:hypothetical protein